MMNPSGYRFEEKKDSPSNSSSYKSTPSSRSSVLERAREYNRKVIGENDSSGSRKSRTAARNNGIPSTRERALASVQRDTARDKTEAALQRDHSPRTPVEQQADEDGVVTPELLVDALSGHEDGLLNIAEKLMAHYDSGYDVMGEALIDAFADVQKLFQHVVEAAHLEGAAFEASRRSNEATPSTPNNAPARHDEYIDQDVKDLLTDAMQQRTKSAIERYDILEKACIDACALMPVDSESRGRLQLSLARAESMDPERAITILTYGMDEIIRTSNTGTSLTDTSKRADVVLQHSVTDDLPTLTAELKDILQAPIYRDTPLHNLAERFWKSLEESQRSQTKHSEMLEENLAKLKAEFLLARAEWEEKLNQANENTRRLQTKVTKLHQRNQPDDDTDTMYGSVKSAASKAETVASGVSGLARSLVQNQFNCTGAVPDDDTMNEDLTHLDIRYERPRSRSRSKSSRSFREYSRSPHRMDV